MFSPINLSSKFKSTTANFHRVRLNTVMCGAFLMVLLWVWWDGLHAPPSFVPRRLQWYCQYPEGYTIPEKELREAELRDLAFKVEKLNSLARVLNWDKYHPVTSETTIIVIQVHKDVERLQYLIISLAQVYHIHQVLLIFSHSFYDDLINVLVKNIHFCKVLQIFYPYSIQLYPNKFPGVDPDDCNTTSPDSPALRVPRAPCFERDAHRTEDKQHWWWTAKYVFDGDWSSDSRTVIFLREDDYVFPDMLHVVQLTRHVLPYIPTTRVMAFGGQPTGRQEADLLTIDSWTPLYDQGLAFTLKTWRMISAKSSFFCFFEDCSWSNSLLAAFANFSGGSAEMVACSVPRVVSTRAAASGRRGARAAWRAARRAGLFPEELRVLLTVDEWGRALRRPRAPSPAERCWTDLRDQILCLEPVLTTTDATTTTAMVSESPIKPPSNTK